MAEKSRARSIEKSSLEREKQRQNKNRYDSGQSAQPEWLNQAIETPSRARPEDILALQRRFGNQAVQRVLDATVQRQAVADEQGQLRQDIATEIRNASQGGQPLPATVRESMGQQLGHDFSDVRIHTGSQADTLNRQLQARAFTLGNSIFFSQGAFDAQTARGRHTLAHELTHVVQQAGGSKGGPLKLGKPDDGYEKEADRVAASRAAAPGVGAAAWADVVQRLPSWRDIRSLFASRSSGGAPGAPAAAGAAPGAAATAVAPGGVAPGAAATAVAPGGAAPGAAAALAPPQAGVASSPQGVSAVDWAKLKANGVADAATWNSFPEPRRQTILLALASSQKLARLLIEGAKRYQWPKDSADAELHSVETLGKVFGSVNVSISEWNRFGDKRSVILECLASPPISLGYELIRAAQGNYWPKGGANDLLGREEIARIRVHLDTPLKDWSKFDEARRTMILTISSLNMAWAIELAGAAKAAGTWPKDQADQDIVNFQTWVEIKEAAHLLTPAQWNQFARDAREHIITAPTSTEKKNLINQAMYAGDKEDTALEKAGEIAEHPVLEGISGAAGMSSSILGASGKDKAGAIVGASADVGGTLLQGVSLLASYSKYRRGSRLDQKGLSSRAAQSLGKKQKREGIWGMTQSTLGIAGGVSSAVGNISKASDADKDKERGTSDTAGKVSGSLAIASGALGTAKGGLGLFRSFRRSSRTQEFIQEGATGDKKVLSGIASFTQRNQNRLGRSFETIKGVSGILSGVSSIIGNDVFASVMGGVGLLSGIAQAVAGKAYAPGESELNERAKELVGLLKNGNLDAIKFAKQTLNITNVTPDTPEGWKEWVLEDPEAATDLIKSKLSKY